MKILVINAGSSSLKYQLIDMDNNECLAKGICEKIGLEMGQFTYKRTDGKKLTYEVAMKNHTEAFKEVKKALLDENVGVVKSLDEIEAVGHRIVHGGPYFFESCLVTDDVISKLEKCVDFAPLHTLAHLMGIHGCMDVMPDTPQVVVFDTAFHQTMPPEAYFYPLPYEMCEKYHIRRYGAHGTSHRFVTREMLKILGKPVEETKLITCHIGNGSSVSAIKGGKVIDTSMGFTPLDGLEMGTRCGSIDPAIVTYVMKKEGYTPDEMSEFMNKECGFLGVSGISSDSRDIEEAIRNGNKRAKLAADILAYQIKKYIGAYTAAMNGVDAIVFTAGMGENNPEMRERVCTNMEYFGIEIDKDLNARMFRQPNTVELSTKNSKVKVYLLPTNEELMIAQDTAEIVQKMK
jgi:acetate kinase